MYVPIVLGLAILVSLSCPASDVHVHTQGWRVYLGQNIEQKASGLEEVRLQRSLKELGRISGGTCPEL